MVWFRSALGNSLRTLAVLAVGLAPATAFAQRVACVGDSITYGYGLGNPTEQAYPALLAEELGSEFEVGNFGNSGSTLQDDGDKPWREQSTYSETLAFLPDVVVVMLGTNDAKPANWSETGFVEDYHAWIAEFRDQGAFVYVATPPPVVPPGAFDIPPDIVNETLVPLVRQIATDADAPLIDVYAALEDRPELFPDTVHPDAAGARVIADTVALALLASDETTTSTQTAVTNSAATNSATSSGGSGGATASSSAAASSSAGLTASSAGPTTGDQTTATATSSGPDPDPASTGAGPATAATQAASTDSGSGTGSAGGAASGGAAAPSERDEGCACKLGAPVPARHTAFWSLVLLAALSRRVRQRRGGV